MEDNLKALILDTIDRTNYAIEVIKYMLDVIQNKDYYLHFCYNDKVVFAGNAEKIENELLRDFEKNTIDKLKQKLQQEKESRDSYIKLLNKYKSELWKR